MAGVTVHVELAPDWREQLTVAETTLLAEDFGPAILADMQAATPVLTGRLRNAERFEIVPGEDGTPQLHVGVYPDDEGIIPYKLAVEFGFHGPEWVRTYTTRTGHVVHAHERIGNSPEQPYMRPAIWRVRTP